MALPATGTDTARRSWTVDTLVLGQWRGPIPALDDRHARGRRGRRHAGRFSWRGERTDPGRGAEHSALEATGVSSLHPWAQPAAAQVVPLHRRHFRVLPGHARRAGRSRSTIGFPRRDPAA